VSASQTGDGSAKFSTKLKCKPDVKPEVPNEYSKASKDKEDVSILAVNRREKMTKIVRQMPR
jgi:hypothetical protein